MSNPFGDTSYVTGENAVVVLPPVMQWHRGDQVSKDHPALKNGGWQITVEQAGAILGDTQPVFDVVHSGGTVVPSYLFERINILVLAYRKRWFYRDGDKVVWLKAGDQYPKEARSKVQVFAVCRELNNEPCILTTSALNAMHLEWSMRDHVKKIITPASRMAKTPFGRHHFWLTLTSAGKWVNENLKKNGQYVTPPMLDIPDEVTVEYLRSLFVDKEMALYAESLIPEAKAWADGLADNQPREETQAGPDFSEAPPPEEEWNPAVEEDHIPF